MHESEFERLIRENEDDLDRIRSSYFSFIRGGIIVGYNLYPDHITVPEGLSVDYSHSDLGPNDRHFRELSNLLRGEGVPLEEKLLVNNQLINRSDILVREADYLTKREWEPTAKTRYFTPNGREIEASEITSFDGPMIKERLEYDLLVRANDEFHLRRLVNLFKKYASRYKLDRLGRKLKIGNIEVKNKDSLDGAFDIPLLTCTNISGQKPKTLRDFVKIYQFNVQENIGNSEVILSTFVRVKAGELRKVLKSLGVRNSSNCRYALRVFVEDYIDR